MRFTELSIRDPDSFIFGKAPHPVTCGRGVVIGSGTVIPEINFTLPPIKIKQATMPQIRDQYTEMVNGICRRALDLKVPALLMEFETLPPMTIEPKIGLEITSLIAVILKNYYETYGLRNALRLTPNDTREHQRPPFMRRGTYWEGMQTMFQGAAEAGADLLAIESTGGKEVCDEALMMGDLRTLAFALGVLAPRDMEFLWKKMVSICRDTGIVPSGDTACGFANTAMVLAEKNLIPRVLAAVVRVMAVPRTLTAYECGAAGPGKDCAYEGPYMKAIAGVPISMEGRTAACAHLSSVGNIAQAVCDCWSNESVANVHLLSAMAPVVSMEQLAYDCRLLNTAAASGKDACLSLRNWLVDSDAGMDPQAYVLRPDVVLRISKLIVGEKDPYRRTRTAAVAALNELREAQKLEKIRLPAREKKWLDILENQALSLPGDENVLIEEMKSSPLKDKFLSEEYGL